MLTSDDYINAVENLAMQREGVSREKERKRIEREESKKQKEEERQVKALEREQKVAERAEEKARLCKKSVKVQHMRAQKAANRLASKTTRTSNVRQITSVEEDVIATLQATEAEANREAMVAMPKGN
jgi:hypothetical protein